MLDATLQDRAAPPVESVSSEELRERYQAYRRRQAARLVQMLPRDAIRPLYRRAARNAPEVGVTPAADDPLALLVHYCEAILPLPPFEVWKEDVARNPDAYFSDTEESVDAPTPAAPSTMDARAVEYGGRRWRASLRSFREAGLWRGYIAFQEEGSERVHRTAAVFCEHDVSELRGRFLSFDLPALQAFLRSALP